MDAERCQQCPFALPLPFYCVYVGASTDDTLLDVTQLCRFPGNKQSIRLHFTVKKCNVHKGELVKVVPASVAESVELELQRTAGVKCRPIEKAVQRRGNGRLWKDYFGI